MFLWLWQLENLVKKYNGITGLISELKSLNIHDVCIKYHEGSEPSNSNGINYKEAFLKYKDNFSKEGFKVGTWGYNYFNNPKKEADMIIDALNNSDYYVFDPEVDVSGKNSQAEQVCQAVRKAHPKAVIGYASFPIVSYHKDIPYSVFNKYCDFASPQAYWKDMGFTVNKAIDEMLSDYKTYGLDKPIYPSIQSYKCTLEEYNTYDSYNFSYTGVWSLDSMDITFEQYVKHHQCIKPKVIDNKTTESDSKVSTTSTTMPEETDTSVQWVKLLQQGLNEGGFTDENGNSLNVDGIIGESTRAAAKKCLIKSGSKGKIVQFIQHSVGVTTDGIYGIPPTNHQTYDGICSYQKKMGLKVDGQVGIDTWTKLFSEV